MKKLIAIILMLALLLAFAPASTADAGVSATTEPAELETGGTVKLKVTVNNSSGAEPIENIRIKGNGIDHLFSDVTVPAGESKTVSIDLTLTTAQLGTVLTFDISWTVGVDSKPGGGSFTVTVARTNWVNLVFDRSYDKRQTTPGNTITLTYKIQNAGTVAIKKITVTDKEVAGSKKLFDDVTLQPGEEQTATYTYTMGNESVPSEPIIVYTPANSETALTQTLSLVTLGMVNPQVELDVTQEQTAEGVTFTVYITNNGNQRLKYIKVTDELGNRLNEESANLAIGEKLVLTYFIANPESERNVRFNINGEDGTGADFEDKTKSYRIAPYIDPALVGMTVDAVVTEPLTAAGSITVKFTVTNSGQIEMKNLVLREAEYGDIKLLANVAAGSSLTEESPLYIGEPRDLAFTLAAEDPSGNLHEYSVYLTASAAGDGAAPIPTPAVDIEDNVKKAVGATISGTLSTLLLVLAIIAGIAGVALVIVSALERREAREIARRKAAKRRAAQRAAQQR